MRSSRSTELCSAPSLPLAGLRPDPTPADAGPPSPAEGGGRTRVSPRSTLRRSFARDRPHPAGGQRPQEALRPRRRPVRAVQARAQGGGRPVLHGGPRRDPVARRRIRLRQVHGRQGADAPLRAHRRPGGARRATHRRSLGRDAAAPAAPHPDGVPGPVLVPQPADAGAGDPGRTDPQFRAGPQRRRPREPARQPDGAGRPAARGAGALFPTSSRAASASASASPGRSPPSRT